MTFISHHRSLFGILGVAALALSFIAAASPAPSNFAEFAPLAVFLLGCYAILGSPYFKIVYREAPLRWATSGKTELDERELAVRDRANGLTYYLFVVFNIVGIAFCASAWRWHWFAIGPHALLRAILPYAWFAISLPIIMLEWFEPSGASRPDQDDEEGLEEL